MKIIPKALKARLAVEMGRSLGGERYVGEHGDVMGIDQFGLSLNRNKSIIDNKLIIDGPCVHPDVEFRVVSAENFRTLQGVRLIVVDPKGAITTTG